MKGRQEKEGFWKEGKTRNEANPGTIFENLYHR
jgi:hypothetical protein